MKGKFYLFPEDKKTYKVIMESMMRDTTGKLKPAVIYTDGDSTYCREKEDFIAKFKPLEIEQ